MGDYNRPSGTFSAELAEREGALGFQGKISEPAKQTVVTGKCRHTDTRFAGLEPHSGQVVRVCTNTECNKEIYGPKLSSLLYA